MVRLYGVKYGPTTGHLIDGRNFSKLKEAREFINTHCLKAWQLITLDFATPMSVSKPAIIDEFVIR